MTDGSLGTCILKFLPFQSFIHNDFWHKYVDIKIDIDRLNETGRTILGTIALRKNKVPMVEVTCSSLNTKYEDDSVLGFRCKGILLNHNTLETFKNCDKKAVLKMEAIKLYSDLLKQESIQSSSDLVKFCLLSFAFRQFLTYLVITSPALAEQGIKCIRITGGTASELQFSEMRIYLPKHVSNVNSLSSWVGWESDENGKYLPRLTSLNNSMSPKRLAENAINLNLKLMKWRLVPSINLTGISRTKCLLLGAGTLGCNVARSLLAWGITHISIVDCGHISLSNPIRQSLYRFEDTLNGGKPKASTVAERLLEINPSAKITGINLKIPMPGHPVGQGNEVNETREILTKLINLIQQHDVIYLLTDSRESRWLPTMLGRFYNKIVMNAALGFDSYLVMRHGFQRNNIMEAEGDTNLSSTVIGGFHKINCCDLGCYFCNDIVAPGNSMKDRTLDQQCTVTRPGVSSMASALAVELMISIIQHGDAPAYYRTPKSDPYAQQQEPEGLLGIIPHSIRGNISTLQSMVTATVRYANCVACSSLVLERYATSGQNFIINILNGSESLEAIAGLHKLISSIDEVNNMKDTLDFGSDFSDDS
ncbi:ubiquitin-like modifier-activating enzyme atg7 isoform X4 [Anopheles merus]|uniref:ubiquitin-like modifier-activating enzyme atg7 isoform X4 n=1 Tax=Anopheles merus TaxID=30066 RepID=UPI001BE481F0|nr:ubiquitin-like modifier-activating enzyme atg7 isoform X4 [Anopheles merus]